METAIKICEMQFYLSLIELDRHFCIFIHKQGSHILFRKKQEVKFRLFKSFAFLPLPRKGGILLRFK